MNVFEEGGNFGFDLRATGGERAVGDILGDERGLAEGGQVVLDEVSLFVDGGQVVGVGVYVGNVVEGSMQSVLKLFGAAGGCGVLADVEGLFFEPALNILGRGFCE